MHLLTAITGASGALYGVRFVARIVQLGATVDLMISAAGKQVAATELGFPLDPGKGRFRELIGEGASRVHTVPVGNIGAASASGSAARDGMIVIPCTMGTLARIAAGTADSLIERAADVTLKEGRRLVVVPRETPLNRIHLSNMLSLVDAGATILPAMPAFYGAQETVNDLVDTVVDRAASLFFGSAAIRRPWDPDAERGP